MKTKTELRTQWLELIFVIYKFDETYYEVIGKSSGRSISELFTCQESIVQMQGLL